MSTHSGTIGRTNRALSLTATAATNQMKRQRSVEWQQERNYSSSEEENDRIGGRINSDANVNNHRKNANNNSNTSPSRDSASVLAQLIAQTQQLSSNAERSYRSDCETDDGISMANESEYVNGSSSQQLTNHSSKMKNRSPLAMRQSSPFPNEMTNNRRMQQYNNAQERLRNGDSIFSAGKGTPAILTNNTLIRGSKALNNNRRPITSSSSTISSQSTNNDTGRNTEKERKDKTHKDNSMQRCYMMDSDIESEPPPEPAPPEIIMPPHHPPLTSHRDISMASMNAISMKQPSNYVLKIDKNGDQIHEEFIPQNQHEYMTVGNAGGYSSSSAATASRPTMANGMSNARMNVTLQGGHTLPGMQGTINSNHMSGSSQLMPGFPLKSSQPYSPSRFNLDKRFQYKCSWKLFSIALIFLSVILTALLAYFAAVSSMKPNIDPSNCILVQDVKSQTLANSQNNHLRSDNNNNNNMNMGSTYGSTGMLSHHQQSSTTEEAQSTMATATTTTPHHHMIYQPNVDQQQLQIHIQPSITELKDFNVAHTSTIPPFQFWNIEFRNKHPAYIQFNFTLPWGANFAVYGRRNVLPSITQHDFVEFFKRERLDHNRLRRKRDVVDEITRHYEKTHEMLADGSNNGGTNVASSGLRRHDNKRLNHNNNNNHHLKSIEMFELAEGLVRSGVGGSENVPKPHMMDTSAFLHLSPDEQHIIAKRSTQPKIDIDALKVNVTVLEYLDVGRWFLAIYNDELVAHTVQLIVSEAEGVSNSCPNDCSSHGSCYLGKCDCIDGYQGADCSKSVCPVLCSAHGHYGGGICHCEDGWKGSECDIPVTECEMPTCSSHGRCIEGECHCDRGWKGPFCDQADCQDPSCSGHGSCVSGQCFCKAGWQGDDCGSRDQQVYKCLPGCSDHGHYDLETASCICDRHWTGKDCSQAVCSLDCGPNGICESARCRCNAGWTGALCEQLSCDSRCTAHGQCKNGTCVCSQGWNGKYCTLPGCENGCSRHGQCTLEDGEYRCNCIEGWAGSDCSIPLEMDCNDGVDNDEDGMIDCSDSECCSHPVCAEHIMCLSSNEPVDVLLRKQPPSVTASFFQRVKFLIEENSVQSYAHKDEYSESEFWSSFISRRVSVLRGQVITSQGLGIVGVRVSVDRDSRFGFTLTRQGGWFDVMVNGGGAITLQFQRSPFRPMTRTVFVPWNQMIVLPPLLMHLVDEDNSIKPKLGRNLAFSFLNSIVYPLSENNSTVKDRSVCKDHDHELLKPHLISTWMPNAIGSMSGKSLIFAEAEIVQESVQIPGSSLYLTYQSSKVPGYSSIVRMQLTSAIIPKTLTLVHVGVEIEGSLHVKTYEADPNIEHTFAWNKRNVYKQKVYGAAIARISIGYEHSTCDDIIWETQTAKLQGFDVDISDIGGWGLNIHHQYNFNEGILQKGDGSTLHLKEYPKVVRSVMGVKQQQRALNCRDKCNGVAKDGKLLTPVALASGPDGSLYVGDFNLVRRIMTDGNVITIAQLSATQVSYQYYLCVSPADGHLYISDPEKHQVLKILYLTNVTDPSTNMEAVVGSGSRCIPGDDENCGDGGLAKNARLSHPKGITISADRTMYIADGTNIRAVDNRGIIYTLIGHHGHHNHWSPIPCKGALLASQVQLQWPTSLALSPLDGSLHFTDDRLVLKLTVDMKIKVVAGSPLHCNINATYDETSLGTVSAIAFSPTGDLFIADSDSRRVNLIRMVDTSGNSKIFAGQPDASMSSTCKCPSSSSSSKKQQSTANGNSSSSSCSCSNNKLSSDGKNNNSNNNNNNLMSIMSSNTKFLAISAMAVTQDNVLNVADKTYLQILSLQHYLPNPDRNTEYHIPYPSCNEIYIFNRFGQHIATKDFSTGKTIYTFLYSKNTSFGKLSTVTDSMANKIQFLRDYSNSVTSIENTQDYKAELKYSSNGYLTRVTEKGKSMISFDYDEHGLMLSRSGNGETFIYQYNELGRVKSVVLPSGEQLELVSKLNVEYGLEVEIKSRVPSLFSQVPANVTSMKMNGGIKSFAMIRSNQMLKASINMNNNSFSIVENDKVMLESSAISRHPSLEKSQLTIEAEMLPMWSHQNLFMNDDVNKMYMAYTMTTEDPRNPQQVLSREIWVNGSRALGLKYEYARNAEQFYDRDHYNILTVTYNNLGLPTSYQPANGFSFNITYDRFNRMEGWSWGPSELKFSYERHGLLSEISSQQDGIISYIYNDNNLLSEIGLASQRKFKMSYDNDGGLRSIELPTGTKHVFDLQRSIGFIRFTYTPPGSSKPYLQHFSYSGALLQTIYPGDGARIVYRYNSHGQLAEIVHGEGKSEFSYNRETGMPNTILHTERDLEYRWDFEYNGGGDLLTEERIDFNAKTGLSNAKFTYEYDSNFRLVSTQGRIGGQNLPSITFAYSTRTGNLEQISQFKITHPKANTTNVYDGTATITRTVDGRYLETEKTVYMHRTQVFKMEFLHDIHGRITQTKMFSRGVGVTNFSNIKNYTYDCDGQLIGVDAQEPWGFRYDDNGNMLALSYRGNDIPMEYNSMDRIIKFGENFYKYDDRGHIVQNAREEKFHYSTQGLLIRATKKGRFDVRYFYDHMNRLVVRKDNVNNVTQFFYNNKERPFEVSQIYSPRDNKLMSLYYDDRGHLIFIQTFRSKYYIATDQCGTPVMIFNQYGEGIREMMRSPFGHIVYDSNPYLYLPIDFCGGLLDPVTSLVHMSNGKVYDPLVGLWMTPNWENTFDRIQLPTKLHQYRFNGNDPVNAKINLKPPSSSIEWLNAIGYTLKSMAPQFNENLWKIATSWNTFNNNRMSENSINHQNGLTIESGFLSHLKERRLTSHENFETTKQSELRSNSSPFSQLRIGSSSEPAFGKGIVVTRTLDGQAIVSSVPAANAIYRDVYTSVFNRTLLLPFTFIVHNSLHDVFHFVKEDSWRSGEDRQQLKRLQGQVNTTFHDVVNKDNASGNNNYLDVKIHGTHAIINLRYGTTVEKEKIRLMHHAKLQAVRKAWAHEKELLADGLLTSTEWIQSDVDEILKQGYSNYYDCQYIHDVNMYPELAEDPYNIKFVKKKLNQAAKKRRRRESNNEMQSNEFES